MRDLVAVRRVVVHDRRVRRREQRRVAVGVLQALTGERGAAGRGADEEAAGHLVGGRPDRVAGALEPEHRVEDVDRDHRLAVRGVATCPTAVNAAIEPASLMPMCRIWPSLDSL